MERITDAILATCREQPDAIALRFRGTAVSYGDLRDRVLTLADQLAAEAAGAPVALHSAKSPNIVIAMLACLAAGMPYVPVDPTSPPLRRARILGDCGARLFLVDTASGARMPDLGEATATVAELGPDGLLAGHHDRAVRAGASLADDAEAGSIAFVLYTSGSTGKPKGVRTSHLNSLTFLGWAQDLVGVTSSDVVSCYAPLHFDMHIFDIYGSLAQGATVVLLDDRTIIFPEAACRTIHDEGVTIAYAVPSAWIAIQQTAAMGAHGLPALRTVMYSGEEYPAKYLRALAASVPQARIINIYGPVETNAVTALDVTPEQLRADRIPIGLPFGQSRVYLLDAEGNVITSPGPVGELVVDTPTAFVGYVGDEAMTRAAFVPVDIGGQCVSCYRTGDFACWDATGLLHFRGRRDGRVKTRGFRVEVGEVEACLLAKPGVAAAVVVARPHQDWTNELVAFVVAEAAAAELVAWCRQRLAPYMVPREIVVTDSLPLTPTGKADRVELARRARRDGGGAQ
jgi:amino acid adenylation domain-containing protein